MVDLSPEYLVSLFSCITYIDSIDSNLATLKNKRRMARFIAGEARPVNGYGLRAYPRKGFKVGFPSPGKLTKDSLRGELLFSVR